MQEEEQHLLGTAQGLPLRGREIAQVKEEEGGHGRRWEEHLVSTVSVNVICSLS